MHRIKAFLERSIPLTDSDWEIFASKFVKQEFSKKTLLLEAGQTENYLSFIEKGIVRFYIPKEENDITFVFAFDNWFMSAYDSFLTREASTYSVETLTDTVLWRMSYTDLQYVYESTSMGDRIGRFASEQLFLIKTKRELSLLKDSAQERYLKLFKEEPHLIKHIPLKYLASYIGITPQALSRIRKQIC